LQNGRPEQLWRNYRTNVTNLTLLDEKVTFLFAPYRHMSMTNEQYPIGKFETPSAFDAAARTERIAGIESAPERLRTAVRDLTAERLDARYREGGWTVRQVVHHLADSHMNCYIRFKLAMTEDAPLIKAYAEELWAELPDAKVSPIEASLALLEALHRRWTLFLRELQPDDFGRTFRHPEYGSVSLDIALAMYAWHGDHHIAQITHLRRRQGW
jgi:uncharacterized damage-inducible protein DinB